MNIIGDELSIILLSVSVVCTIVNLIMMIHLLKDYIDLDFNRRFPNSPSAIAARKAKQERIAKIKSFVMFWNRL